MVEIGKYSRLKVASKVSFGVYMDGSELGEILLPTRYVPVGAEVGDEFEVFIYRDSEDRIIATTERPFAQVGEFAALEVATVSEVGAFMNWGLMKDLFVPFKEQKYKIRKGETHVIYVYLDEETARITGTTKLERYLDQSPPYYKQDQEVDLLIFQQTELGYKAVINGMHLGVIYKTDVFKKIEVPSKAKGYIKRIREDFKIDLTLNKKVREQIGDFAEELFEELKKSGGKLPFNDNTPSELVYERFGISKKVFKKALGALYKQRLIDMTTEGIVISKG